MKKKTTGIMYNVKNMCIYTHTCRSIDIWRREGLEKKVTREGDEIYADIRNRDFTTLVVVYNRVPLHSHCDQPLAIHSYFLVFFCSSFHSSVFRPAQPSWANSLTLPRSPSNAHSSITWTQLSFNPNAPCSPSILLWEKNKKYE